MSDLESSQRSTISSNVRLSGPRTMSSRTNRGLHDLINKSFQIHTSTPLRGFLSGRRNLYRYEESLTTTLCDGLLLKPASSSVASTAGDQNIKGVLDSVHMETFTIPGWPSSKPGVILIVKTRMHKADRPIEHQFYMIPSIGQEDDLSGVLAYYPILLSKSKYNVGSHVTSWFMKHFDCRMEPMQISSRNLEQIVELWFEGLGDLPPTELERVKVGTHTVKQQLELVYSVPQIDTFSDICITVQNEDLLGIYSMIRDNDKKIMDSLHEHVFHITRVKVTSLPLTRIGTPLVLMSHEGKIKLINNSRAKDLRMVLECLCDWASMSLL
ncbi:hypothetical protein O0I10_006386 [Lichtheimia ornata]|uniref:Centromere protein L n=1 Tax=Lichtheimia ornata TaxID=688661 RepID=A0AAD7V1Y1_9FUNG|nr:uncharacterized protein O0I10_006386 [Lichtheimia ornata]KAJ8657858.1 hypothetical protein O0I10_006386 [Lichtheimia ornata]